MRKYRIKYNLIISNTALQSANNKFELHKKVTAILEDVYNELLNNNKLFKSVFKNGNHKITMEIKSENEKSK